VKGGGRGLLAAGHAYQPVDEIGLG
jgi:hypothetical protein